MSVVPSSCPRIAVTSSPTPSAARPTSPSPATGSSRTLTTASIADRDHRIPSAEWSSTPSTPAAEPSPRSPRHARRPHAHRPRRLAAIVLLASGSTRFDEAGRHTKCSRTSSSTAASITSASPASSPPAAPSPTPAADSPPTPPPTTTPARSSLTAGGTSYVLTRHGLRPRRAGPPRPPPTTARSRQHARRRRTASSIGLDPLGNSVATPSTATATSSPPTRSETCTISGVDHHRNLCLGSFVRRLNRPIVTGDARPRRELQSESAFGCCSWRHFRSAARLATANGTIFTLHRLRQPKQPHESDRSQAEHHGLDLRRRQPASREPMRHLRPSGDGKQRHLDTVTTRRRYDANSNSIRLVDDNGGTTGWLTTCSTARRHDVPRRLDAHERLQRRQRFVGYTDENGSVFANTFDVLGRKTSSPSRRRPASSARPPRASSSTACRRMTFGRDTVGTTNADVGFIRDSIGRVLEEAQTYVGDTPLRHARPWTSYPATGFTFPNSRQITIAVDALYRKNELTRPPAERRIAAWQFFGTARAGHRHARQRHHLLVHEQRPDELARSKPAERILRAWGSISTDQLGYDGSGRHDRQATSSPAHTPALVGFTTPLTHQQQALRARPARREPQQPLPQLRFDGPPAGIPARHARHRRRQHHHPDRASRHEQPADLRPRWPGQLEEHDPSRRRAVSRSRRTRRTTSSTN